MPKAGTVFVAEDVETNLALMRRVLLREGYDVRTAADGETALREILRSPPDIAVLDVMMPGLNGFEVCRRLKQHPATRLVPVILVTGLRDREDRIRGIHAGADDFLTKPFDIEELRARLASLIRLKRYTDELDSAESLLLTLALTIEARDASTYGHCQRLAGFATEMGRMLNLPEVDLAALARGGFLHDIGKVSISDDILLKPARLAPAEYEAIKIHTVVGDRLCGSMRLLERVRPIVRHHHERLDGSGYPDALRGDAIPLLAQIIGIVDVYDALTNNRPYRLADPPERAWEILRDEARRGWHQRELVEMFIELRERNRTAPATIHSLRIVPTLAE